MEQRLNRFVGVAPGLALRPAERDDVVGHASRMRQSEEKLPPDLRPISRRRPVLPRWHRADLQRGAPTGASAAERRVAAARVAAAAAACSSTVVSSSRVTTGRPLTRSSSSGGRAPRIRPATGSAMPACARPSTRHRAMSASLPGSSEPSSPARPIRRAPPSVASSSDCRTVSACGPPAARAMSTASRASPISELSSFEAEPSTPRPTGTPAAIRSAVRQIPAPSLALDDGQCAMPVPVAASRAIAASSRCTAVRQPDVVCQPAQRVEVLDRGAAEVLRAELVLVGRLGDVGVQPHPVLTGESRGRGHQRARHGERRARRDAHPQHRPGRRIMKGRDRLGGPGKDRVDVLGDLVGRQAARRGAQVHRPPRRVEAQADVPAPRRWSRRARRRRRAGTRSGGRCSSCSRSWPARPAPRSPRRARSARRSSPTPDTARSASRTASSRRPARASPTGTGDGGC